MDNFVPRVDKCWNIVREYLGKYSFLTTFAMRMLSIATKKRPLNSLEPSFRIALGVLLRSPSYAAAASLLIWARFGPESVPESELLRASETGNADDEANRPSLLRLTSAWLERSAAARPWLVDRTSSRSIFYDRNSYDSASAIRRNSKRNQCSAGDSKKILSLRVAHRSLTWAQKAGALIRAYKLT